MISRREKWALASVLGAGLALASWVLYCVVVSGWPWPNTAYIKTTVGQESGLASGLDWTSLVVQLIQLERTPATPLEIEKITNTSRLTSLSTVGTRLSELRTAADALKEAGLFSGRTATVGGTTTWTASAADATASGSHTFVVSNLATQARLTGGADIGTGIAATNDVSGVTISSMGTSTAVTAGEFTVNGARVTVDPTDSLQDLFDAISTATGGDVTASYDAATDRITLTSGSGTPVQLGAANDTSNFLTVARLFNNGTDSVSSAGSLGSVSSTATLENARLRTAITAVDGDGKGSFTINGVAIEYDIHTDSLSTVLARINASSAGVTASFDSASDRVILTNKATGDLGISVNEAAGGLLGALGLTSGTTFSAGENAAFTINGGSTLYSTSNTFTEDTHGIPGLSVTATSEDTQTVTIAADTAEMKSKIETFITKFNAVQSFIDDQTRITTTNGKVTAGNLSSNREVQNWAQQLRRAAFSAVSGLTGTVQRLEHLGIDFTAGTSQLAIKDPTKLEAALRDHPNDVEAFFSTASTGFVAQLDSLFTSYIGVNGNGGLLDSQKTSLTKANSGIDEQIAAIERRLEMRREQMEAAFMAMETAQSKLQQMQTQLANAFPTTSSNKK